MKKNMSYSAEKILEELNKYIVSQEEAKKSMVICLKNRERRKKIEDSELRKEIKPKNIILVGSTGSGKTEIARRLAAIVDAPFLKVEATKYTEVGYVGKDVSSIVRDLVEVGIEKVREREIREDMPRLEAEVLKIINDKIVERHLDEAKYRLEKSNTANINLGIKQGLFDDFTINIEVSRKDEDGPVIEVIGNSEEDGLQSLLEQIGKFEPKPEEIKVKVREAKDILTKELKKKQVDTRMTVSKALDEVQNEGIVFIDEIDKVIENSAANGDVSRQGVQRDLLPLVEGTTVMTKHGPVKTDNILFIAAGAFFRTTPQELMPELQGRFPVKVKLKKLVKEDFIKILTKVKYNLLEQYKAMLIQDGVKLNFTASGIEKIAQITDDMNGKLEDLGARRLVTVVEAVLQDIMFEAPYESEKTIKIDKKFIEKIFEKEIKVENLDKYIL